MSTSAASPIFMSKLKDRKEVAERTIAFRFEKPSGWTFKAGQFIDMTLLDPSETDSEGNTRGFRSRAVLTKKCLWWRRASVIRRSSVC